MLHGVRAVRLIGPRVARRGSNKAEKIRHPGEEMRSRQLLASLLAASSVFALSSVQASVVITTGASLITAPGSIVPNTAAIESNTLASVFNELQNVTLLQAATVDATTSGFFNSVASLTPGSIAAGTLVSSHYLHVDPVGSSGTVYTYRGTVTFDADILGVSARNAQILDTNFLGAPGTTYTTSGNVNGLDYGDGTLDSFTISGDRRTLSFVLQAWAGADALRVITAGNAVPEPGALGLVFAALGALALTRRRQVAQT